MGGRQFLNLSRIALSITLDSLSSLSYFFFSFLNFALVCVQKKNEYSITWDTLGTTNQYNTERAYTDTLISIGCDSAEKICFASRPLYSPTPLLFFRLLFGQQHVVVFLHWPKEMVNGNLHVQPIFIQSLLPVFHILLLTYITVASGQTCTLVQSNFLTKKKKKRVYWIYFCPWVFFFVPFASIILTYLQFCVCVCVCGENAIQRMLIFVAQTRISLEVCTCIYPVRYVDEYSILGANKKGKKKW